MTTRPPWSQWPTPEDIDEYEPAQPGEHGPAAGIATAAIGGAASAARAGRSLLSRAHLPRRGGSGHLPRPRAPRSRG